jgi:hypothetical protein
MDSRRRLSTDDEFLGCVEAFLAWHLPICYRSTGHMDR